MAPLLSSDARTMRPEEMVALQPTEASLLPYSPPNFYPSLNAVECVDPFER